MSSADRRRRRGPGGRRPARAALGAAVLMTALSGCVSTQQRARWLHVQDERIIAAQSPTVVSAPGRSLLVLGVTVLRGRGRWEVAVEVRNPGSRALGDIPISVLQRAGRDRHTVYLNSAAGLDYFDAHLVSIPARATETWVMSLPARIGAGRVFAVAGDELDPALGPGAWLPRLRVSLLGPAGAGGGAVRVRVSNPTGVPQPDLQLYAIALAGDRIAAAGASTLGSLAGGTSSTATVSLVGNPRGARVEVEALPTLF